MYFLAGIFFCHASSSIKPLVFRQWLVFLFPTESAMKWEITDDQYSDERISLVRPLGKMLPMDFVPYTDGINPLVKLFNGVVEEWMSF